jgi:hypothetical protein
VSIPLQETGVDYVIAAGTNLQVASLVELQRELSGVGENTFLIKGEC